VCPAGPAALAGLRAARAEFTDLQHVAVFDTAFHAGIPPAAHRWAVPTEWYEQHGVRRYGFHGTSHAFVARRAAHLLGRPPAGLAVVTAHLGNGASVAAVRGGVSVDTSMGLGPLAGLVMGTRSGDLDPTVVFHLVREAGMSLDEVERALNRSSGLLGLAGSNDLRDVEAAAARGEAGAVLAVDVLVHRLVAYVGAYATGMGRLDALVFTAGVGEHSVLVRRRVCERLGLLGVTLDQARNESVRGEARIDAGTGPAVLVVPTDEEGEIARQVAAVLVG
jgi:acetate kinase